MPSTVKCGSHYHSKSRRQDTNAKETLEAANEDLFYILHVGYVCVCVLYLSKFTFPLSVFFSVWLIHELELFFLFWITLSWRTQRKIQACLEIQRCCEGLPHWVAFITCWAPLPPVQCSEGTESLDNGHMSPAQRSITIRCSFIFGAHKRV